MRLWMLFQEFKLIDDKVLQEHHEDPRLVQMTLLGENSEFWQKSQSRSRALVRGTLTSPLLFAQMSFLK